MSEIFPALFCLLIWGVLALSTGAIFLRLAVKLATKFDVSFGQACRVMFVYFVVTGIYRYLIDFVAVGGGAPSMNVRILSLPVYLCVISGLFGTMIILPDTGRAIGFKKGMLVTLILFLMPIAIALFLYIFCTLYMR